MRRWLRSLQAQLFLWAILPVTFVIIALAFTGVYTHQQTMRDFVAERDLALARLTARMVEDGLAHGVVGVDSTGLDTWTSQMVGDQIGTVLVVDGEVQGVRLQDGLSGQEAEVRGRIVVNAAGPWVDQVCRMGNPQTRRRVGGTIGSHLVVSYQGKGPRHAVFGFARSDNRAFFVIPWLEYHLIGTTDIRYEGNPDEAQASDAEVEYLTRETNRLLPQHPLGPKDVLYTYAGVRALPPTEGVEPRRLRVRGLGFLPGACCPHYDGFKDGTPRRDRMRRALLKYGGIGIGIDERCAVEFGEGAFRVHRAKPGASAYLLRVQRGAIEETMLPDEWTAPVWHGGLR